VEIVHLQRQLLCEPAVEEARVAGVGADGAEAMPVAGGDLVPRQAALALGHELELHRGAVDPVLRADAPDEQVRPVGNVADDPFDGSQAEVVAVQRRPCVPRTSRHSFLTPPKRQSGCDLTLCRQREI